MAHKEEKQLSAFNDQHGFKLKSLRHSHKEVTMVMKNMNAYVKIMCKYRNTGIRDI